jgi:flagellin
MRELAVQAANGTYTSAQRNAMDMEYQHLKQDIAAVSRNTRWNGMSLLNAQAGTSVTPKALYKAVSAGQTSELYGGKTAWNATLYDTLSTPTSISQSTLTATTGVNFSHKGTIVVDLTGAIPVATFKKLDGSVSTLNFNLDFADQITLGKQDGLMSAALTLKTASPLTFGGTQRWEITVDSSPELNAIQDKDLTINGIDIQAASPDTLDTVSPAGNAATSAITKVAQINQHSDQTGVTAVVNRNLMGGRAMSLQGVMTGTLSINGYLTASITTSASDSNVTRQQVLNSINALTSRTGVKAIDSQLTYGGISLIADDGRNIEVEMFSLDNTKFAAAIGMRNGIQVGTYSLAVQDGKGLKVDAPLQGNLQHSGLSRGTYTAANLSTVVTSERPIVNVMQDVQYLHAGDLLINGVAIPAAKTSDDSLSDITTDTSSRAASGIALATAVNTVRDKTGVTALVQPVLINGTEMTTKFEGDTTLVVNGKSMNFTMIADETVTNRKSRLIDAINQQLSAATGVDAIDNGTNGISLKARDGRNISVWYEKDAGSHTGDLTGSEFGLAVRLNPTSNPTDIPGISHGDIGQSRAGSTFYAGVVLQSTRDIAIQAGPHAVVDGVAKTLSENSVSNTNGLMPDGDYAMTSASGAHAVIRVINAVPHLLDPGQGFQVNDVLTSEVRPAFTVHVTGIVPTYSRFNALGFTETDTSVTSTIQAEHYQPPAVSRLDFQVGNRVGEKISIDLPDFGEQGSITHLVTWDVGHTYFSPDATDTTTGAHVVSTANGLGRTTLGQDIDAVTTTIPVRSTEGFPPSGTVYIDNELITYTGLTANSLTGVGRGAMNTTAQTHRGDAIVRKSSDALLSNLYTVDPLAPPLQVGLTVEPPPSHLLDQNTASNALLSLDAALYQVNQARSNMGAVMNRLEYSVSNLYDTYTNMSASRSKIEDADYAAESSDMARAQIIQQAATAILAQANTNQQTVLKLLQ